MANVSISDLPAAAALDGTEVVHGLQSGNSRSVTSRQMADLSVPTLNRALNERPFEAPPSLVDNFNALAPPAPAFGRQVNLNSKSEDLTDAHYSKDNLSLVAGDTITWRGVTLQRVTIPVANFFARLRDLRSSDYALVSGRRYIASALICAPFIESDANDFAGPWNRFCWMWSPATATDYGHGAKLIGPTPRRIWTLVEWDGTNFRRIQDPATGLSSTPSSSTSLSWFNHGYGLAGTLPGQDFYLGGLQLEEAPSQSEKAGIALIGTSIDTGTSSLKHATTERAWPRWLEGLLNVPLFNGAVGGQTSTQLEARFDTDITPWAVNAKYCILACNVNDFSSGFSSATYRANWLSMRNKAIAAGMIPIMMTPPRRSTYDYANGPTDMQAEIDYIKATYPFVIDRDEVWQDVIDADLLNDVYEADGIHPNTRGHRALAFAIYHKYRHFFAFENVPGPYQKTVNDNAKVQSFGAPVWVNRLQATRVTSTSATAIRDTEAGTAPLIILEAALAGATTYQLPCSNYQRPSERVNTDVAVQRIRNATTGGQSVSVQYYARDAADALSAVGPAIGPIPAGETWTVMCDGTTAWRAIG